MNAILLLLAFGAGLATGLLRFLAPAPVILLLVAAALCTRRWSAGTFLLAAGLGRCLALVAWLATSATCTARLSAQPVVLEVRLMEPVDPGAGPVLVRPIGLGCRGAIEARWPESSSLQAGTRSRIEGRWLSRPDRFGRPGGLLLVKRSAAGATAPSPAEHLRNWLAATTRRLYGTRTGTVEALIVNRRGAMPVELRDRYARAGLVHILSISGFHVGVIVGWVVLLSRVAGLPPVRAGLAGAVVAVAYVVFLGWPPPAARAALLAGVAALSHWRQRNPAPLPLLAVTCLVVLLADPWAALDAGAWLSALALGGALIATRWSDRALGPSWTWRTLSGSVGATLATAPVTAWLFGMVSLAGIGLNFLAIPLAAVAVPGVILSLVGAAIAPPLAAALASGSGALLGLLDQLAWWGGRWDAITVMQPQEIESSLPWVALLGLAGWGIAGRTGRLEALRRWSLALAVVVWGLLLVEFGAGVPHRTPGLALHFLDVGQGDAALLRTPGGHWVLIDAGPATERSDAGRRVIAPFLARQRAPGLALAVISHAHLDHLGGLRGVLNRFPVARVLEPGALIGDSLYTGFLDLLAEQGIPWTAARDGMAFTVDSVRFRVLHPDARWAEWQSDVNEDSVVLLAEYGRFRALFVGDAGLPAESRLAGRVGAVTVLKVGHHGSRSASGDRWLGELRPQLAVVSAGQGNRYGHPHAEVVTRLRRDGIGAWRTDQDGTVSIFTDGHLVRLTSAGRDTSFTLSP